jgi:hypothetical protein
MYPSLPDNNFEKSFSCSFTIYIYPLISLCQLLFRRNKTALSSFWDIAPDFYEGKGDVRMITNNGLQLSLLDHSNSTVKIAFGRSLCGSKKRVIEKISTVSD